MARPQKEGMDYFPHDVDAVNDEKIEALRSLYGNDGYAFYFILLERIYRSKHFELDVSEAETIQILSRKIGISADMFDKMLSTSIKHGAFSSTEYHERKVLTSNGIKKRANVVLSKREAMKDRYTTKVSGIVSAAETPQKTEEETPQSKVKGKRKESKKIFIPPTLDEITEYINEKQYSVDPKRFFDYFEAGNWHDSQGKPVKSWKQKMVTWDKKDNSKVNGINQQKKPHAVQPADPIRMERRKAWD